MILDREILWSTGARVGEHLKRLWRITLLHHDPCKRVGHFRGWCLLKRTLCILARSLVALLLINPSQIVERNDVVWLCFQRDLEISFGRVVSMSGDVQRPQGAEPLMDLQDDRFATSTTRSSRRSHRQWRSMPAPGRQPAPTMDFSDTRFGMRQQRLCNAGHP